VRKGVDPQALLGLLSLAGCWAGAAALGAYAADTGLHAVKVGAYLPGWLVAAATLPWWAALLPGAADALAAGWHARMAPWLFRAIVWTNAALLTGYVFCALAIVYYVAFATNGIS
jgi:hypothetical protein